MILRRVLIAGCLTFALSVLAAEKLNIKPGLWEVTSLSEMAGIPTLPPEILAKMTPEQRVQMEGALKAQGAKGPQKSVDRECITQKDLERPFEPDSDDESCKQTVVATTRTTQEVRMVCKEASGSFKVTAPTPETMAATFEIKGGGMTIKSQLKGRWLGADCGDEAEDEDDSE
jgi:hypothetical protein